MSSSPQEATLEDQLNWGKSVALANGWEITREFSGVGSGAKGTRDLLKELLAELRVTPKARRPKHVLMIRLDRLGRGDGMENIAALSDLRGLGVTVFTRDDGDVRLSSASDAILPAMKSIVAGIENEIRSEKWKAVHARRRAAGLHVGHVPFGVVLVEGRATPYEPEAAIVRQIFAYAEMRWGYTRLARFALENAPPKRLKDGSGRPYSWKSSSIKSILESKTIRGLVVTEEQWLAAKAARLPDFRARAARRWPWPLQGAVRCTCGKVLSGHCSGNGQYRKRYYVCKNHSLEPGDTSHPAHRADSMEACFVRLLERLEGSPDVFLEVDEPDRTLEQLQAAQRESRRSVVDLERRKQKAWALAEEGQVSAPELQSRLAELDSQLHRAQAALADATAAITRAGTARKTRLSLAEILDGLAELWKNATVDSQRQLACALSDFVGGFLAMPDRRGELLAPTDVATLQKTDDSITKKFIQTITE